MERSSSTVAREAVALRSSGWGAACTAPVQGVAAEQRCAGQYWSLWLPSERTGLSSKEHTRHPLFTEGSVYPCEVGI